MSFHIISYGYVTRQKVYGMAYQKRKDSAGWKEM